MRNYFLLGCFLMTQVVAQQSTPLQLPAEQNAQPEGGAPKSPNMPVPQNLFGAPASLPALQGAAPSGNSDPGQPIIAPNGAVNPGNPTVPTLPAAAKPSNPNANIKLGGAAPTGLPKAAVIRDSNLTMMNLVDADITAVVKAVGLLTNRNIIVDPRVKGTITLQFDKPVSKDQAWQALLGQLRLLGFAMVENLGIYKVVPEPEAKLQTGTVNVDKVVARGDQIITQIFTLSYENANNLVNVLRPLISPNNTISPVPGSNSLVITDYADNLKRIAAIIAALDISNVGNTEVVALKNATASELVPVLEKLTGDLIKSQGASPDIILADNRSNVLTIRSASKAQLAQIVTVAKRLDEQAQTGNLIRVVYLKNADATRLAETLRSVLTGQAGSTSTSPAAAAAASQQTTGAVSKPANLQTATLSVLGGTVQAEPELNALIINAPEPVYRTMLETISKLDVRRPQVYIEAMIVEISGNNEDSLGFQWQTLLGNRDSNYPVALGTNFGNGGDNLLGLTTSAAAAAVSGSSSGIKTPGTGLNIALLRKFGSGFAMAGLARFFESTVGANILSTPNILTLDNEEAKIVVGQNVPFVTGQYSQTGSTSNSVNPFQTIERKDVGLTLKVKPQISEGGQIKLAVYQEVSSVVPQTSSAGLITNKRSIDTNVLVQDGEIIALGGLMEDRQQVQNDKVPLLGDVPVLGALFRSSSTTRVKTNLVVFLRPVVLRTAQDSQPITQMRYQQLQQNSQENATSNQFDSKSMPQLPATFPTVYEPLIQLRLTK